MTNKIETRGRKPIAPEDRKAPQATVKVNEFILPFVKELKGNLKKGNVTEKTMERLFNALDNKWEQVDLLTNNQAVDDSQLVDLQAEVERLKADLSKSIQTQAVKPLEPSERLEFVKRYDAEHLKAVKFENKTVSLKNDIERLKTSNELLKHAEHDCQALKANGDRCTRTAKSKLNWHGVQINVCHQHSKKVT